MGSITSIWIGLLLLLGSLTPTLAQHAPQRLSGAREVTEIEGSIIALRWVDPHVGFSILGRNGSVWEIEAGSIRALSEANITPRTLSIGTELVIAGFRAEHGERQLYASHLLLPNGTEIVLSPGASRRWTGPKR